MKGISNQTLVGLSICLPGFDRMVYPPLRVSASKVITESSSSSDKPAKLKIEGELIPR